MINTALTHLIKIVEILNFAMIGVQKYRHNHIHCRVTKVTICKDKRSKGYKG